ncbi:hypothetical protein FQN55_004498 [Onygenales sp. PD_40]|nr:hypothetical protein FQN55_004498 [Onygenales sp. PD_40]
MSGFIQLYRQIDRHVKYSKASKQAKHSYFDQLPGLLERQCQLGNLQRLPPPAPGASQGYIMTDKGATLVLEVYADLGLAVAEYNVTRELFHKVVIYASTTAPGLQGDVRSRIGQRWPPGTLERLKGKDTWPFGWRAPVSKLQRPRMGAGVIGKAAKSMQFGDLLIPRYLGLAQLAGIEQLHGTDLLDLIADAPFYEKLVRTYLALTIGNIDKSALSNASFGPLFNNQRIGSTQYIPENFSALAPTMPGTTVQIGTMHNNAVNLTYPQPLEQCHNVKFTVRSDVQAQDGEALFMLYGWAVSLALRPAPNAPFPTDIHGSPLLHSAASSEFQLSIKRAADGRLFAKPALFRSFLKPPTVTGQGVYGRACRCTVPDPRRRIDTAAGTRVVNGVVLGGDPAAAPFAVNVASAAVTGEQAGEALTFDDVRLVWEGSDLPMLLFAVDLYPYSTYVQVPGECLACAVDRAVGVGCWIIVAGAFGLFTAG